MSYTKFSKEVTKWLKDNGLPCYGTANDSPEETKARLDAWMRGSKEILRQWITEKRYRELISCAHGGWYQDDVIFEPLAEHFVANHPVSYTHLDVYKRQEYGKLYAKYEYQDEIECFPDVFALIERELRHLRILFSIRYNHNFS